MFNFPNIKKQWNLKYHLSADKQNDSAADGCWGLRRMERFLVRAIHFTKRQHHLYLVPWHQWRWIGTWRTKGQFSMFIWGLLMVLGSRQGGRQGPGAPRWARSLTPTLTPIQWAAGISAPHLPFFVWPSHCFSFYFLIVRFKRAPKENAF